MNTEVARTNNPFGSATPAPVEQSAVAVSDAQRAVGEIQARLVVAKQFPRDPMKATEAILNACTRPTLANTALYIYTKGGNEINGPSIRLAEAMAQEWGNMDYGIRELSSVNGVSTVEAFAWDTEKNTMQTKVFQVAHEIQLKGGKKKKLTDPRDIYEHVANMGARRMRACILGVIPGDITEAAVNQCHVTQAANIDTSPEAIKKMVEYFGEKYGVSKELIEKRIQRKIESIRPAQMQSLKNIAESLKDGMSSPSDWFEIGTVEDTGGPATSELGDEIIGKQQEAEPEPEGDKKPAAKKPTSRRSSKSGDKESAGTFEPNQDAAPADDVSTQPPWASSQDPVQYFLDQIKGADTMDKLDEVVSVMSEFCKSDDCTADQQKHLENMMISRAGEIQAIVDQDPTKQ